MTSQSIHPLLVSHPALLALEQSLRDEFFGAVELRHYEIGQPITFDRQLSSQVHLLLDGQARLMCRDQDRWITLGQLGPGDWVGLASILRVGPCEEVAASSPLLTAVIPEQLAVRLVQDSGFFREACSRPFTAELAKLLQLLRHAQPMMQLSLKQSLAQLADQALLVLGKIDPVPEGLEVYVACCNLEALSYGTRLDVWPDQLKLSPRPPLPLRLIALPASACKPSPLHNSVDTHTHNFTISRGTSVDQAALPVASGIDLGQDEFAQKARFRLLRAVGALDETLACFQMLAAELELPLRRDSVEKILRDVLRRGQTPDLQLCGQIASMLGLHVSGATIPAAMGTRLQVPALLYWKEGLALLRSSNSAGISLASPRDGFVELTPPEIAEFYPEGLTLLMVERTIQTPEKRFGPSWFLPALQRYRNILIQVLLASFVVQMFGLAGPLLIQVIIDKVISQRSLDTLQVLGTALVVVTLLEGVLGSLRTFLFTETSNRIDLRLGSEVIDHLLRLPLDYFDKRPVGELGTRIAELEKIRSFLTGQALSTVLDALLSTVYIVVMFFYSWLLTLIALAVLPIQIGITLLGAPLFRRQFRDAAQENARTQSHLVEVLTGIQTVKAQNIEMISRWKWQDFYSRYISRTFEKTITGTALSETSQVLQKLSQLLVLWVGAVLVLKGELSLGQLIAFRIIAGYVTQPLLRLSSIWQNIQELKVSFERLADVVDTPEESSEADKQKIALPPINGEVKFDRVGFTFSKGHAPVLNDICIEIPVSTFVGVVGQSGSGKSTLTKMLSRLYAPTSGRILIDGYDISKVELYSLRRQIGIVPQDPLLFSGSVADNIALGDPEASSDAIVEAARMACAHDFIMEMPSGYSSDVGERGAGLSGGQRQRIALARTLLLQPRLLVLDEATSALDYDTEKRVCNNLLDNLCNSTVFFITHRLSTIRRADHILMMHQGALVESGSHESLMAMKGRYFALYRQQDAG
jgi:subfamily B ATP-binding cassette protein HlyB/CyaB